MKLLVNIIYFTIIYLKYNCHGANILGIFNNNLYGSFMLGQRLFLELSKNGHNLTLVNSYKEITDLSFSSIFFEIPEDKSLLWDEINSMSISERIYYNYKKSIKRTNLTLSNSAIQELMAQEKFDVVILEQEYNDALKGICHHFRAHCVVLSSTRPSFKTNHLVNNISPPSFVPEIFTGYPSQMSYFQRAYNLIRKYYLNYKLHNNYLNEENYLVEKYFSEIPNIYDLISNVSLILLNWHFSFNQPVPYMPNMIPVGGLHIKLPKELPTYLQDILDDSTEGIVYINFGEEFETRHLPKHKIESIINVVSRLDMKILWKYEDDDMPNQPDNVHIEKWFPQQDILAHPNVKLFITRGGTLSMIESITFGVPVLGIPMNEEDIFNVMHAVENGFGLRLTYDEINEDNFDKAITTILNDARYSENGKLQRLVLLDRPVLPLNLAVYWIEYVIRHNGALFLQSPTLKLSWYQYYLLDLVLFLFLVTVTPFILIIILCQKCKRAKFCNSRKDVIIDDREEWKKLI